jgi:S-adenosylmethionine-diacylgycerolhomoserine-N-methlytransferase
MCQRDLEDILDDGEFKTEEAGTYDLVLLTYSLTMIPNWAKTIQKANAYLKPGGKLAVTDFTVTEHQSSISRWWWKKMFANTHIHLNQYHIHMLQTEMNEEYLRIEDGDFPYVPYMRCPFFYGIFSKNCKTNDSIIIFEKYIINLYKTNDSSIVC